VWAKKRVLLLVLPLVPVVLEVSLVFLALAGQSMLLALQVLLVLQVLGPGALLVGLAC
jgi:hypothetical protein